MTITRPPKEPGKQAPNHERYMANKSAGQLRRTSRRGFSTFVNALAFSTLLSSQETDAHRCFELPFSAPGRLIQFTRDFLFVKSDPVRNFRSLEAVLTFEFPLLLAL